MLIRWTVSLVLVVALTELGMAAGVKQDTPGLLGDAIKQQSSAQLHTEKRSKRDSMSPGFYQGSAEDSDDGESLSDSPTRPDPDITDQDVTDMFGEPAALQDLYGSAGTEAYGGDEDDDDDDDDLSSLFYASYGNRDVADQDDDFDEKRTRLFVGKRARLFVGKRPQPSADKRRLFVGKRPEPSVDKRRLFVGKRPEPSVDKRRLFVGKRPQTSAEKRRLFVGKRQRLFVGKKSRLFVGKRQRLFVGKRPRLFVGKRQRLFVGKRDWQANVQRRLQEFLEQRDRMRNDFVGKRYKFLGNFQADKRPQRMFIGKRDDASQILQEIRDLDDKRARLFVGKRDPFTTDFSDEQKRFREFVGKRQQELLDNEDAPGQMDLSHADFGDGTKRSSRMFVGKRPEPAPYDFMEKRHRYFVGKRASGFEGDNVKGNSVDNDASAVKDESLKRSREFVGGR
ncbi:hypothetical protein RRG08_015457 [Elysia crispata]|uniref:Uncharacterized protein n=1 Tax=Elysia crispata TaxID=231223 RepID=A0AAE1CYL6_9GAST|nr:hypothetical protein RRG08_015457 [Elysia crispata]